MNISFKSTLVPTEYLKSAFDYSIERGYEGHDLLDTVNTILNDGKDDVIKIDGTPGSKMSTGQAKRHDIFVNNKKVVDADYHFGLIFDGPQCVKALMGFAGKRNEKLQQSVYSALDDIQNNIISCIEEYNIAEGSQQPEKILKDVDFFNKKQEKLPYYDGIKGCARQFGKILKSVLYVKHQQEGLVTKELIDAKNKIFG